MQEKTFSIEGVDLFCRISGSGFPVLFIHGFGDDGSIWENQVPALEKNYQLIIPDLPGSGRSPMLANTSMESLADVLKQLLDALQIPAPVVIGHSMGGYIALAFAEKYPDRLSALSLFHSGAFADNEERIAVRRRGIAFIQEHGAAKFLEQSIPNLFSPGFKAQHPETVQEIIDRFTNFLPQSLVSYYEAMIQRPDRTAVLKNLGRPVQFIMGKYDTAVPLEQGLQQCHLPRLSYVHILKHTAHKGMYEEVETSNGLLENFLKNYEIG